MTFLFSQPSAPTPPPPPPSPMNDPEATRQRAAAEEAAVRERASAGRRSTIVGGMKLAADEQYARGSAAQARRTALG